MGHGIRALAEVRALTARLTLLATDEDGMSTAEYPVGVLYTHEHFAQAVTRIDRRQTFPPD